MIFDGCVFDAAAFDASTCGDAPSSGGMAGPRRTPPRPRDPFADPIVLDDEDLLVIGEF